MKRALTLLGLVVAVVLGPVAAASAHPLGNFTINHYSGIHVSPDEIRVDYVIDMAEIPAFQEMEAIDTDGDDIQAARYTERALALGTPNALFLFHAGTIQAALGHDDEARSLLREALDTNPHFSIQHAPEAQALLENLGVAR